jgi:hypothetical protein
MSALVEALYLYSSVQDSANVAYRQDKLYDGNPVGALISINSRGHFPHMKLKIMEIVPGLIRSDNQDILQLSRFRVQVRFDPSP